MYTSRDSKKSKQKAHCLCTSQGALEISHKEEKEDVAAVAAGVFGKKKKRVRAGPEKKEAEQGLVRNERGAGAVVKRKKVLEHGEHGG